MTQKESSCLTPRELEIVSLVAQGLSNPAIARELYVAPGTVKTHLSNISEKLGTSQIPDSNTRFSTIQFLVKQGVINCPFCDCKGNGQL